MNIHESGEDYLETILILERQKGNVRSIDIANELGYSKPSVSRAMSILKNAELITMDEDYQIHLTEAGRARASKVYERHRMLTDFFISLGVDKENAENDACRIEHVISQTTFNRIKDYMETNSN
jgi:DtxR family Mn-dependent transcriptional regulator